MTNYKQPSVFVPHGGGPMPLLGDKRHADMVEWLKHFQRDFVTTKPDAIVLVTAHWESEITQITSSEAPELLYDYYNFPPESYEIKYPAPGHPALAKRIHDLLSDNGIKSEMNEKRGYDHGVFIPLKIMFPDADVPVVQMSVYSSQDPEAHIKLGEVLRSLRKDNILIVGSGLSFHSFGLFRGNPDGANAASIPFHDYLKESLVDTSDSIERRRRLHNWTDAPFARQVHQKEEHLMPLFVVAGAGLEEPCEEIFDGYVMDVRTSGYLFGKRS
ncbi:hypothetical protein Poli38472_004627 [Pythium oligandrum]|uniref:Extradiol ring-cleavage dioxygenase class III enzyme subunit B domain-containing protein n=1 Tax=Pythium oligandrum TaxID=41045 RepID=A0A8K1CBE2_PYTOL|nr:hypothetical protein Poli38472_004627 [Pythium oligandrum]|eukprot:TMW59558.1 hypothetical protein Poli38472_004627 [Pythium oligandrum]